MTEINQASPQETQVRTDKLRLLYEQSFPGVLTSLVTALVFSFALWPVQRPALLISWFSLLFLTALGRFFLFLRYRLAQPQGEEILNWETPYFVTLSLTTLTWSIGGLVLMPADSPIHQVIILTFMIGLSGGAISLYSAHRLMTTITIAILMLPVTLWFLHKGDTLSLSLVIGSIIFIAALIRAAIFLESTLHKNFALTRELRAGEEQLRLASTVFDHSQDGIFVTNTDGTIVDANPACTLITGYARDEIIGQKPSMFSSGKHEQAFYEELWSELKSAGHWQGEIWNRQKDGGIYAQRISIDAVDDEVGERIYYVAVFHDISHLKEHEAELHEMAYHDVLTGLPNRLLFRDRIALALKQAKRNQKEITVCYLDLDDFKPINDTYGHNAGDQLLIEVARRLESVVREGDTVARVGGDEFVILLIDYEKDTSPKKSVQRLLSVVADPYVMSFGQVFVTASIGVASAPQDADETGELLRLADSAMYTAKSRGGNQYSLYQSTQK